MKMKAEACILFKKNDDVFIALYGRIIVNHSSKGTSIIPPSSPSNLFKILS